MHLWKTRALQLSVDKLTGLLVHTMGVGSTLSTSSLQLSVAPRQHFRYKNAKLRLVAELRCPRMSGMRRTSAKEYFLKRT